MIKIMTIYDAIEIILLIGYIINDVPCRMMFEEMKLFEMMIGKISMRIKFGKTACKKIQERLTDGKYKVYEMNLFTIPLNITYTTRQKTKMLLDDIEDYMEYAVLHHDVEDQESVHIEIIWRNYEKAINWILSSDLEDEQPRYVSFLLLYINFKIAIVFF